MLDESKVLYYKNKYGEYLGNYPIVSYVGYKKLMPALFYLFINDYPKLFKESQKNKEVRKYVAKLVYQRGQIDAMLVFSRIKEDLNYIKSRHSLYTKREQAKIINETDWDKFYNAFIKDKHTKDACIYLNCSYLEKSSYPTFMNVFYDQGYNRIMFNKINELLKENADE